MTFAIPAAPGTFLRHKDGDAPSIPVVGWMIHPFSRATPVIYEDFDLKLDLYEYEIVSPDAAPPVRTKPVGAPPSAAREPAAPASTAGPIRFTGKQYTKRTFWHFTVGAEQAISICEGGNPVPVGDAALKISRDDFYAMKKRIRDIPYEEAPAWVAAAMTPPAPKSTAIADDDMDDLL
jgi:hypothetical protein